MSTFSNPKILVVKSKPIKLLFVCLGNICRSPLAHAVFESIVAKNGKEEYYFVESCGTGGWHVGEQADNRMIRTAAKHDVTVNHLARKFSESHFEEYNYIFGMDENNVEDLHSFAKKEEHHHKIHLLGEFSEPDGSGNLVVPDPYYGGPDGFEKVFEIVNLSCNNLFQALEKARNLSV